MKVTFRKSFLRDLKKLKNRKMRRRIQQKIEEIEGAASLLKECVS